MKSTASGTTIKRARALRKEMTLPEVLLWRALRDRPGGLKFRRQHPDGVYVADFYCHEARLVIEVDGAVHNASDQAARDETRDQYFMERGIFTLRIAAADILRNIAAAVENILATANQRQPLHHTSCGPPPPIEGEEFKEV